jgi:uncharacterized protein YndB with AHSA1/START domain
VTADDPRDRPDVDAAPVKGAAEIEIAAPRQRVWEVLTAFEDWPSWNPDVKSVSMEGPVAEGSEFRWKAGPGTITSRIRRLDEPGRILWTGTTFGIKAIHVYTLEPRDGRTLVKSEESYHGLVSRLFRRSLQKTLDKALASGLQHLKAEAERRAPAEPSSD